MNTRFWQTNGFRVTLGTLISIVFLVLAFKDVPLNEVAHAFTQVNYFWILVAVLGMLLQSWLRAWRWVTLYHPLQHGLRVWRMFGIVLISQMLNIAVPWRVGELARIYLMGEIEKRSKAQTLATLGVEKIFDTLMLFVLLLIIPPFMTLPAWLERPREGIVSLTIVLFVAAFGVMLMRNVIVRLLEQVRIPWSARSLGELAHLALTSLDVLKRMDLHLWLQLLSVMIWLIGVVVNYLVFLAMDLPLPWISAFLLMAVLMVGGIVPSSPGKLGVFQYLCILTLGLFNVDKSIGLTYGIWLYLVAYGTPILGGIVALWWEGVNVQRLTAGDAA
jgi:uncharacterized protein (TIRG00374 family)